MQDQSNSQIIIRHVSGAKNNKIDQFRLDSTKEISFGRDVSSSVNYDSPKDDVVSRKHAVLRVSYTDPPSFFLEDLRSSNGTFVNGNRLMGQVELYPEDTVEFGSGGPRFIFDVQPRPTGLGARTRVMSKFETTDTHPVRSPTPPETPSAQPASPIPIEPRPAAPAKVGVGQHTVRRMLFEERKKTSQTWMGALAAILIFVATGGGWLYWTNRTATQEVKAEVHAEMGLPPGDIANAYGNAVVLIEYSWRLFDVASGQKVYHRRWKSCESGIERPAYLQIAESEIYPILTTDSRLGYDMGLIGAGTGVVVSSQGFVLTNRHVAAGWMELAPAEYASESKGSPVHTGWLLTPSGAKDIRKCPYGETTIDLTDKKWNPETDGAFLCGEKGCGTKRQDLLGSRKNFIGRNEFLEVRFAGADQTVSATLVRASPNSDIALIKVETPQTLQAVELSPDDEVKIGERVVVLGYPGIAYKSLQIDRSGLGQKFHEISKPSVTNGLVAQGYREREVTLGGDREVVNTLNMIEMSGLATGSGGSGGPVFDGKGRVIGLFTAITTDRLGARMSYAVPIKAGRDLLTAQKPI
jgi:serine protease Do